VKLSFYVSIFGSFFNITKILRKTFEINPIFVKSSSKSIFRPYVYQITWFHAIFEQQESAGLGWIFSFKDSYIAKTIFVYKLRSRRKVV